jgi:hypothetical protein
MPASISLRPLLQPRLKASAGRDHFRNRATAIWAPRLQKLHRVMRQANADFADDFVVCFTFHFET